MERSYSEWKKAGYYDNEDEPETYDQRRNRTVNKGRAVLATGAGGVVGGVVGGIYASKVPSDALRKKNALVKKFDASTSTKQKNLISEIRKLEDKIASVSSATSMIGSGASVVAFHKGMSPATIASISLAGSVTAMALNYKDNLKKNILVRNYENSLTESQKEMAKEIIKYTNKLTLRAAGFTILGTALGAGIGYLTARGTEKK